MSRAASASALLIPFLLCLNSASSSNILFVSCVISPSHFIFNKALAEGLAARGHNVTFVSADKEENPPENIHYIHLENIYSHYFNESQFAEQSKQASVDLMEFTNTPDLLVVVMLYEIGSVLCDAAARSNGLKAINSYPNDFKFDLVIYDYTFSPCLLGLVHKFNYPPLIGISAFSNPSYTSDVVGGDKLGLTVKPYYLFYYDNKNMKFHQRVYNGLINFVDSFYRKYIAMPTYDKHVKEMFGEDTMYIGDIERRMALALVNTHPAIDDAESLPPNVIEVGGLQVKEPKALDDADIDEFLKSGKKGSILVSFGTNFRSDQMGAERWKIFVETFRQLPDFNFLWKFETAEHLADLPPNVRTRAWVPQGDILAHKSVVAFVSHCGLLSTYEATYHAVPVVGIPLFVDQHRNVHKAVAAGVAVKVNFESLSVASLKSAIVEITSDVRFKRNMEIRSRLFRDQPQTPLERAIWWCEYVTRTPSVGHLRQADFNFGLLGSSFWDIQLMILAVVYAVYRLLKWAICRRSKSRYVKEKVQ